MTHRLLAPTFLFRFAAPLRYRKTIWSPRGAMLEEAYTLPSFGELEGRPLFADVRAAWNKTGIAFSVEVVGKKQPPWCRESRLEDSDGFQVWIDSRDAHNIHRASRFCHRFAFLPAGGGRSLKEPVAALASISRAKEEPKPVRPNLLKAITKRSNDGYHLQAFVPTEAITGFDPDEHPKIGFTYAVVDRELGWQTFSVGPEFPFVEDPSLWGSLELTDADAR
jgi:hypothetical protein